MSSIVCGHQTCVAYPKTGRTTARYKVRRVRWLDISKAHLRKNPSSLLALAHFSVTCLDQVKSLDIQTPKSFSVVVTSSGLPASWYECSTGLTFLVILWHLHLSSLKVRPEEADQFPKLVKPRLHERFFACDGDAIFF